MMTWSIGRKVTVGFGLALAILALVDVVSYRSITALADTARQVTHTHRVLDELDGVLAQLKNAETGQRGYLLTGDERYLEPYNTAVRELRDEVESLRRLTADNETQQHRISVLDTLIAQKLAELGETIALQRAGEFEAAVEVVRTDEGKAVMDGIRELLDGMEREALRVLDLRNEATRQQTRFTFYIIGLGSLLGLLLVGLAVYVIDIDVRKRERAEQALQTAYDQLELRVRERTIELKGANEELASEIAERQGAQQQLADVFVEVAKSRDDMQGILNRLQLGTAIVGEHGLVEFVSDTAERLLGRRRDDIVGTCWEESFPLGDHDKEQLRTALDSGGARRPDMPVRLENPAGRQYWINIDVQGDPRHATRKIVVLYDVSEAYDLRRQLDTRARFHGLVGASGSMQRVYQLIHQVATVDSTVLIEGATGTGKELVARAIHFLSRRKDRPFVAVNSAGLTDALLTSQLFGHKRGSFTGAVADQEGFFEAANGGTLFLDEIGDISQSVQATLLRALQEKEITRLGESRPRKVEIRVLAATQHELGREVEKGTFRADLLYRIRVARIVLPPLRDRPEDIPLLVNFFLEQARTTIEKDVRGVSDDALRLLLGYHWPGNVRELKSAIEFALIHTQGPMIRATDLPPEVHGSVGLDQLADYPGGGEHQRFTATLRQARGNRSEAARLLGMSRSTLYRRLSELNLLSRTHEGDVPSDTPRPAP